MMFKIILTGFEKLISVPIGSGKTQICVTYSLQVLKKKWKSAASHYYNKI